MKNILIALGLVLLVNSSYAQQEAQFTQYMYNTTVVNPAYAGNSEGMSIFLLSRSQWVGLDGAPITSNISIHSPINNSLGIGVSIYNDKIGPADESSIAIDFSYTISISEKYDLSFGLKASGNLLNIDFNQLNKYDENDYSFDTNIVNNFSPNIGVGLYLHSNKTYVGISAPHLMETTHFDKYANIGADSHVANERIHYYLIAGHVFDLSPELKFKPAILTKVVEGAPLQLDISANFLFSEKFTVGLAYRVNAAFSAMAGLQANDSWFFGYSYDLDTTRLANYNSGTHEIFLRYELFNRFGKIVSPRFF